MDWRKGHIRFGLDGFVVKANFGSTVWGLDPAFASAVAANLAIETIKGMTFRTQIDF